MDPTEKFLPHLIELRQRLISCALAYVIILAPLLYFSRELYALVAKPVLNTLPQGGMLVATQVVTPFTTPLKLSLFAN